MGAGAAGTWRKPKAALSYGSPVTLVVKNLPDEAKDVRDTGVIPESGRSPGGGHGNTLQCSCLENPLDRGAWWLQVHGVSELGLTE